MIFTDRPPPRRFSSVSVRGRSARKAAPRNLGQSIETLHWVANKRFEISKFKFKFPRARTYEIIGLVLGCIEAKFCKQILVGKLSPRSTQCTPLHRSLTWASITCSDPRPSAKSYAFGGDTLKIPDDVDYAYMGIKKQKASNFRFFPFPLFTSIVSDFSDPA